MSDHPRQIIAIGGGGFIADLENPLLDLYVLAQARTKVPAVCYIGTATGDTDRLVARFYTAYSRLACRPTHLPLFARTPDVRDLLLQQDVIYVGGGNTKSMLAVWREWNLPAVLKEAWTQGTVLAGVSAGAICWFDQGVTDSWADVLHTMSCLGFLPGTCCPHYDSEPDRRPSVHAFVEDGTTDNVLALDDGVGAHFIGRKHVATVSARATGTAYRVRRRGAGLVETALPVIRLADYAGLL
ncbi:MAG: peptidase E [Acidobacteria bacterium]|nr:peptidase E [Acidobacteriota bacterium]